MLLFQPVVSETEDPAHKHHKVVKYSRSPIMSTYLLAFVVGEYDYVEGKDVNGVLIRVYTPVGKKEQGQFALDVSIYLLWYRRPCSINTILCLGFILWKYISDSNVNTKSRTLFLSVLNFYFHFSLFR